MTSKPPQLDRVTPLPTQVLPAEAPPIAAYPPALYAAVHDGVPGDLAYYARRCEGATSVLELGCGAGRVAAALSSAGHEVTGIDHVPGLVRLAEDAAPRARFALGDMRTLRLGRTFDRVLCPFNGLYCLLHEEDQHAALQVALEHLAPGGSLIFDAYAADAFHQDAPQRGRDQPERVKSVHALGTSWDVFEESSWTTREQRIDACYHHVPEDGRDRIVATIPQRYLRAAELPGLLQDAGLVVQTLHGSFDGSEYDADSAYLIVTAVAAIEA